MYRIISVNFVEFYSEIVSQEDLNKYLINSNCNSPGQLVLTLEPGRNLIQKGPYILPPIRWLNSFEYNAEFKIICDVK